MADSTQQQLEQAFNLIQQEQLDEAIGLLRQVIEKQPNNIDAWWLMANAVTEPEDAHEALSNVLRLNPNHAEAREAYDQLVGQFPNLKPPQSPASSSDADDFSADISVDIDDLLRRTGPLDERRNEPLKKPDDATDVSGSYLDELWEARTAEQQSTGEIDLDDLFGGKDVVDVPATPTEEEDLEALFGVTSQTGKRETGTAKKRETGNLSALDDGLLESEAELETEESDLDALFAGAEDIDMGVDSLALEGEAEEETSDLDLDALFASTPTPTATSKASTQTAEDLFADPFAASEPAFMQDVAKADEPAPKKRREPREPKPKPAPKARPVVVAAEEAPPDPFELERRANRRSRTPRIVLLLALIAIAAVGVLLIWQTQVRAPGNDPVSNALALTLSNLAASSKFGEINGNVDGGTVRISVCSVPGPALQSKVYQAMDLIADEVAKVRDSVKAAQIQVLMCGKPDRVLYRASAPIDAVNSYVDSGKKNVRVYRAAWQRS